MATDAYPANETMRAARLIAPGRVRIDSVGRPQPGPGQLRIRVQGCGVCASNLIPWAGPEWMQFPTEPGALGHEGWGLGDVGGEGVEVVAQGDRFGFLSGKAYAEYDVADAPPAVKLPEDVSGTDLPPEP